MKNTKSLTKEIIATAVAQALSIYDVSPEKAPFKVTQAQQPEHGDYAVNVALVLARVLERKPRDIADELKGEITKHLPNGLVDTIEVAGPGFINLFLSQSYLIDMVYNIQDQGNQYLTGYTDDTRTHVVEYSSPNIAKPFTIGHLRSTIIGDSIARVLAHAGHKVVRDNHLGDWGTQFGTMIYAILEWGNLDAIEKSERPIKELVALYQRFDREAEKDEALRDEARAWFAKLEKGDETAVSIWKKCIELSMKEFDQIYDRLGVTFDTALGESFFQDKMEVVLEELKDKNLMQESKGALVVFFDEEKHLTPLIVQKSDGSSIYATRDLATDRYRKETYGDDVVILNEVGMDHELYFKQIFEAERLLGYFELGQRVHIKHGMYRFPEGKMSTRKGNVIWLSDVLDEARKLALDAAKGDQDVAEIAALGAIKFNDLSRDPTKSINFTWESILTMQGDTGPYLQYTVVRIRSLVEKAESQGLYLPERGAVDQFSPEEIMVLRAMERFGLALDAAVSEYAPRHIAAYSLELAREFNGFYNKVKIIQSKSRTGLLVASATANLLQLCLGLLGIKVPEKM